MGRPKVIAGDTEKVSVRLPAALVGRLRDDAAAAGVGLSELVRQRLSTVAGEGVAWRGDGETGSPSAAGPACSPGSSPGAPSRPEPVILDDLDPARHCADGHVWVFMNATLGTRCQVCHTPKH